MVETSCYTIEALKGTYIRVNMNSTTFLVSLLFHVVMLITSQRTDNEEKIFFLQENADSNDQLLIVTWENGFNGEVSNCEHINDVAYIRDVLEEASTQNIREVDQSEFQDLLEDCNDITRRHNNKRPLAAPAKGENTTEGEGGWKLIFPGTEWCGAGETAENDDDLGHFAHTDKCCRAHDKCNETIPAGETKYNLTNTTPFTKLSCKCDDAFYDCLDRVDSVISNKIGNIYFNILRRECYMSEYPKTEKCKAHRTFLKITCKEYERNTTAPKIYQWMKPKLYKKLPVPGPLTITLPSI